MIPKRVVVVAADKALAKRIAASVMAAGASAEIVATVDELAGRYDAEIFVFAGAPSEQGLSWLLAQAPAEAQVVPILPSSDLAAAIRLLTDVRVPAVLVSDPFDGAQITAALTKLLYGDLFGVEKVMPWGVKVHSILVGDFQEKARAIASVSEFAGAMGVRRKYRESIEQVIDELLMNALYDAPVDAQGKSVFADVPIKERLAMRVEEKAVVQYACDGERFALSVRDAFGSLRKSTVLSFLDKCLHALPDGQGGGQIDRKTSGAGLGLYLIANAASQVSFHIFPGTATEVVCAFDLTAARMQLRELGLFEERPSSGKPSSGPRTMVRRRRRDDLVGPPPAQAAMPRSLTVALSLSTALLVIAVGLVVAPALRKPAAATLVVETEPRGARVYVDGRSRGVADRELRVEGLEAGHTYALRATAAGRRDEERMVAATAGDQSVRLQLGASPSGVLSIESEPEGAEVLLDGKAIGKVTPATVEISGSSSVVTLRRSGYADQKLNVTAPAAGERAVYRARLALSLDVAELTLVVSGGYVGEEIEPSVPPTVMIDGMVLMPPGRHHDELLKPRVPHTLVVSSPGFATVSQELRLDGAEQRALQIELKAGGTLELSANLAMKVAIDGKPAGATPLTIGLVEGEHKVTLFSGKPLAAVEVPITIVRGATLQKSIELGRVVVTAPGVLAKPAGTKRGATEVALPVGEQKLTLVGPGGEERVKEVTITTTAKTVIDTF